MDRASGVGNGIRVHLHEPGSLVHQRRVDLGVGNGADLGVERGQLVVHVVNILGDVVGHTSRRGDSRHNLTDHLSELLLEGGDTLGEDSVLLVDFSERDLVLGLGGGSLASRWAVACWHLVVYFSNYKLNKIK